MKEHIVAPRRMVTIKVEIGQSLEATACADCLLMNASNDVGKARRGPS